MLRRLLPFTALVVALALGTGCSSDHPSAAPDTPSSSAAKALAKPPRTGACYRLTVASALQSSSTSPAVPCSGPHTSRTIMVGRIAPTTNGHPVAMDSAGAQTRIATRCRAQVDAYVGGSRETQRLSRVQAVWFSPTPEAAAQGARWFRCDVVVAATTQAFAPLPTKVKGLLDRSGALDHYGTCGTAAPGTKNFSRVLCRAHHTWKARATITLPAGSRYLAKAAGRKADAQCRDVEASRAVNILRLRWSFEWPSRAQWAGGQRYGLCWTPDS